MKQFEVFAALLYLSCCSITLQSNILFLNTWNSKSHGRTMMELAKRLSSRGHSVSLYSQVPKGLGEWGGGINTIESILPEGVITDDQRHVDALFWNAEMSPLIFETPHMIGWQYLTNLINDSSLHTVLNTPYDFVFIDELFPCAQTAIAMKLREKYNSKVAIFSTTDLFSHFSHNRALSRNPVTYPSYYTKGYKIDEYDPLDFSKRVRTLIDDIFLEKVMLGKYANHWIQRAGELLNVEASFEKMFEHSAGSFIDYPRRYGNPAPISNQMIYIGEHCQNADVLPADIRTFVEDPTSKGTIYVAFGSIVNWMAGPPQVVANFFEVLSNFTDYRVIWTYQGPKMKNVPKHIMLTKWAPQKDILAHPKTVLFFTHGGLKSIREGICAGVPLLFLPFFADQPKNALYAKLMGIAENMYKKNITTENLYSKISTVLNSKTIPQRVKKVSAMFVDNVMDALDLGCFWTEKIIRSTERHGSYLKIKGINNSWLTYLQFDIGILLLSLLAIVS